jgi:hypothetical protein
MVVTSAAVSCGSTLDSNAATAGISARGFRRREVSSAVYANAHRLEVARRHGFKVDGRVLQPGGVHVHLSLEQQSAVPADDAMGKRTVEHRSRRPDAGKASGAVDEVVDSLMASRVGRIPGLVQLTQVERQDVRRIEPEVERGKPTKTLARECAGHEQSHGHRHLSHHERASRLPSNPASWLPHRQGIH